MNSSIAIMEGFPGYIVEFKKQGEESVYVILSIYLRKRKGYEHIHTYLLIIEKNRIKKTPKCF